MGFYHYDGGVVADQATGRPLMGQPVKIFDEETDAPIQAYREGQPVTLVTGAHGLIKQFQTEDSTRRVRMEVGPVRLRQWSQEMIAAAADASGSISSALEQVEVVRAEAAAIVPRMEQIESMAGLAPGEVTDARTADLITQPDTSTRAALNAQVADLVNGQAPVAVIDSPGDIEVRTSLSATQARTMYAVVIAERGLATSSGGRHVCRFGGATSADGRFVFTTKPQSSTLESSVATKDGTPSRNVLDGGPGAGVGVPTIIWVTLDDLSGLSPKVQTGGETGAPIGARNIDLPGEGFGDAMWKRDSPGLFTVSYVAMYQGAHTLKERRDAIHQLRTRFPYPEMPSPTGATANHVTDFRSASTVPADWATSETTWGIVRGVLRDARTS